MVSAGRGYTCFGLHALPIFSTILQDWIDEQHITMTLLDSGAAIAQRVKSLLDCFGISADGDVLDEPLTFYASDLTDNVPATARRLSQVPISFVDGNFCPSMFNQTFAQSFIQLWVLCKIRLIDLQF